ncbi:hypothetical protein GQ54DRAFT_32992 [Martensiomyces pterosporus]|nr:hypothetical protein GQ54DRAFT_32992 [Martensiomyces pterosporus]
MLRSVVATHTRMLFSQAPRLTPRSAAGTPSLLARRGYTSQKANLDKEIETITDLATTAKDEMDFAEESRNSVYYNDDKMAAHEAVEEMAAAYNELLERLGAEDKESVKTRIGMKIKEIQSAYEIMTLNDLED